MLDFGHTKLVDFDFSILFIFKISIVAGSEICLGNFIAVLFFHDSLIQNASALYEPPASSRAKSKKLQNP